MCANATINAPKVCSVICQIKSTINISTDYGFENPMPITEVMAKNKNPNTLPTTSALRCKFLIFLWIRLCSKILVKTNEITMYTKAENNIKIPLGY